MFTSWLSVFFALGGFVLLGMLTLYLFDRLLENEREPEKKEVVNAVGFRIAAIYSLVLGLSFSSLSADFLEASQANEKQAAVAAQLILTLGEVETMNVQPAQNQVIIMINRQLSARKTGSSGLISGPDPTEPFGRLLDLMRPVPNLSERDQEVLKRAEETAWELRQLRLIELAKQSDSLNTALWIILVLGFILITACLAIHPPSRARTIFVTAWSVFVGVCGFLTYEVGRPYQGLIQADSSALTLLVDSDLSD